MIRFICSLALILGLTASAHADVIDMLKAGLAARTRGDFDGAIHYYTQAIDTGELSEADLATVLNSRGVAYDVKGQTDKAVADFDAAIKLRSNYGEAYINRGLARAQRGDYDRAIEDFTAATTLDARFAYLAFNNLGIAYGEKRDFERALQNFDQAIRLRPDYPNAYYGRGNIYNAMGEADRAIADFDAAIRINPDFQPAYTNRGGANIVKGNVDRAIADFDAAIRLNSRDAVAFSNRGYAYGMKGEYDRAITELTEAIKRDPYNGSIYFKRGLVLFYSGHPEIASQDFATAVRLWPSDAYGVIWLHLARVRAGQDDSRELARNAANIDRGNWPSLVVDLHLGSATHDAVSRSAISKNGDRTRRNRACDIEFYLATFDLEQGERDEARQHLRAAVNLCAPDAIERVAAHAELAAIASKQ